MRPRTWPNSLLKQLKSSHKESRRTRERKDITKSFLQKKCPPLGIIDPKKRNRQRDDSKKEVVVEEELEIYMTNSKRRSTSRREKKLQRLYCCSIAGLNKSGSKEPEKPEGITLDEYYRNKGIDFDVITAAKKEPVKKGEVNAEWIKKEKLTVLQTKEDKKASEEEQKADKKQNRRQNNEKVGLSEHLNSDLFGLTP